jgi:hypothetical protein
MYWFTSSSSNTTTPAIETPSTGITSLAGFSAAIAAVLAGVLTVLQGLDVLAITQPVKIALIGLAGAGILAWAIAAAGDSLARAYAVVHVTRIEGKDNQLALQTAAFRLADADATAHGLKLKTPANTADGEASAATPSVYALSSPAASKEYCLELSPPLKVKAGAITVKIKTEGGMRPNATWWKHLAVVMCRKSRTRFLCA